MEASVFFFFFFLMDSGRCLAFRILGMSKHYLVLQQIYTCFLLGNLHELVTTTTISFFLFLHKPGHIFNLDPKSLTQDLSAKTLTVHLNSSASFFLLNSQFKHHNVCICVCVHTHAKEFPNE